MAHHAPRMEYGMLARHRPVKRGLSTQLDTESLVVDAADQNRHRLFQFLR